jgi:glycosyltransferase involved in cell wall biosynthesis
MHIDTERGWRGGERQTFWLAQELARRGHASVIAARAGEPLRARAGAAGLICVDCAPANEIDPLAAWRLRRAIGAHAIDIVHAHTAHAVAVAALATVGSGVPFVVSRRVDFGLRNNAGTRLKYARAAAFIAISQAVARVLERSGVAPERIRVVPDGVDIHRVVATPAAGVLESLGIASDRPLVVQVAQLVGHKDPLTFVRAMARVRERVPGAQALMVGDGPLRPAVEREIHALGLDGVVRLAGYRTDADSLLAVATVATLSSSEEGMGSVLLDALAFGRAVAATNAGGIPEVIVDGVSGVLAPVGDAAALGDAIISLICDGALRERVAANARLRANEFSVEVMADRTIAVYEEALSR